MTNASAIVIFSLVVCALIGDAIFNDGIATMFTLKKANDFREWIAVWR